MIKISTDYCFLNMKITVWSLQVDPLEYALTSLEKHNYNESLLSNSETNI